MAQPETTQNNYNAWYRRHRKEVGYGMIGGLAVAAVGGGILGARSTSWIEEHGESKINRREIKTAERCIEVVRQHLTTGDRAVVDLAALTKKEQSDCGVDGINDSPRAPRYLDSAVTQVALPTIPALEAEIADNQHDLTDSDTVNRALGGFAGAMFGFGLGTAGVAVVSRRIVARPPMPPVAPGAE